MELYKPKAVWSRWDSGWYQSIATSGYDAKGVISEDNPDVTGQANYAFFPLYPLIFGTFSEISGIEPMTSGFIFSNVFFFFGLIGLFELVALLKKADPNDAVSYLIAFPTAFLFSAVLTESLFFALAVWCIYFAIKKKWLLAGILGFLLSMTRFVGVAIVIVLITEYLVQQDFFDKLKIQLKKEVLKQKLKGSVVLVKETLINNHSYLWIFLVPLGFAVFMLFVYNLTGDVFAIFRIQEEWGKSTVNPILTLYRYLGTPIPWVIFGSAFTISTIGFLVVCWRKIRFDYVIYSLLLIVIPLSGSSHYIHIASMPRYILVIFPIYLILSKLTKDRPFMKQLIISSMLMLQIFLFMSWVLYKNFVI